MPLRDHFRPPLDDVHSWDMLHGLWPAVIAQHLFKILPEPYFAAPGISLGSLYEVDIGTFRESDSDDCGPSIAVYAPPKPTLTLEPDLPGQDLYEVRIYDGRRKRRLVATIELVSPSNKDRPDRRMAFVSKVSALLTNGIHSNWNRVTKKPAGRCGFGKKRHLSFLLTQPIQTVFCEPSHVSRWGGLAPSANAGWLAGSLDGSPDHWMACWIIG